MKHGVSDDRYMAHGLFYDSEPEKGKQPPLWGLLLTAVQKDVTLPNPTAATR